MKSDRTYLEHVRDALQRVLDYTAEGKAAFMADQKTQDAVLRNLEVVGEAIKQVSADLRDVHFDIPWRRIAGLRDRLIHGYFGVDLGLVWEMVDSQVPDLHERIEGILREMEQASR